MNASALPLIRDPIAVLAAALALLLGRLWDALARPLCAIVHTDAICEAMVDTVVDSVDSGTTDASGDIAIYTAAFGALLCTINLAAPPAFEAAGATTARTANANSLPRTGTATAAGDAAKFRLRDRDNTEVLSGDVGTVGSDMNLSNVTIAVNDEISLNTISYQGPA